MKCIGSDVKIQTAGTNGTCTIKSGYITCPVCSCTKFYTTLQRRYGQFSCVGCYRFFKEFFVQPKRFTCPNLGECVLDQRTKCKACWIQRCIDIYTVDDSRKAVLLAHRPLKKSTSSSVKSSSVANNNQQQVSSSSTRKSSSTIVPSINGSNVPPVVEGSSLDALNSVAPAHSPLSEVANVNSNLSSGGNNSNGPQANGSNDTGDIGDGCDGSDRIGLSPNAHGVDDADGCISNDEEPSVLTSDPNSKTASSKSVGTNSSSSISNNQPLNNNNSIKCESDSEESANSIEDADDLPLDGEEGNSSLNMLQASASFPSSASLDEASNNNHSNLGITTTRAGKTPPRRKTSGRIKNWCCLKCANCLADDCGKCINCLDRPKFGGPFIRKQRCLYKKCLMKTKPVAGNQPY